MASTGEADLLDADAKVHRDRDRDNSRGGKGGKGGRDKKMRGGNNGGGGGSASREVQISKALSRLLRHQAENAGIKLDAEGFAPLDRVLEWGSLKTLGVTVDEVRAVVADNSKQRFSMKPLSTPSSSSSSTSDIRGLDASQLLIRANQGHSIRLESSGLLVPVTIEQGNVPEKVVHGTYFAFWSAIVRSGGLKTMGRNHVHCSTGLPEEGVKSGMRSDAELLIELDVELSLVEGIKWWKSDNDVLLTEGNADGVLSTRYFKLVKGRQRDVGVLFRNGEHVGDLPPGLKIRMPHGKTPRGGGGGGGGKGGRGGSSKAEENGA